MEIYHLKTFIAVGNEGHLTRAAKLLHTSQPAVSSHIKALEEELGVQLFKRTPKGMSLTHAGEKLKIQAQIALDSVRDIKSQAKMIKENLTGIITPENCRFNKITQKIFTEKNIHPVTIAVADEESTIQRLVASGAGVSLMIKDEARPLVRDGKIAIWNQDMANLELYFTHEKKYAQSPNLKAIKESIMHVWNIS
jgi:DNA-binding transcriptional LysR family regulator